MTPRPHARDLPAPHATPQRSILLGMWGGPVATTVAFMGGLFVVRSCTTAAIAARIGLAGLATVLSALALAVAWRSWRTVRDDVPVAAGGVAGRNRFLAMFSVAGNALGVLISLWLLATALVLDECLRA